MFEVLDMRGMSLGDLENLQERIRKDQDVWSKRRKKASGHVVIKGAGRRSGKVRIRPMPGRRDAAGLAAADEALRDIEFKLRQVEAEFARRAASEAKARA